MWGQGAALMGADEDGSWRRAAMCCAFWACFGFFRWSDSRTWTDVPTEFLTYDPMYALLLRSDCLCQMEFMAVHDAVRADPAEMGLLFLWFVIPWP
jgi:hypothetical protein